MVFRKIVKEEGKTYVNKDGKEKEKSVYDNIKRLSTKERFKESLHHGNMQSNKMLNMALTFFNPNNVNYSHSTALQSHITINTAPQIITHFDLWNRTFNFLEMTKPDNLRNYFKRKDG